LASWVGFAPLALGYLLCSKRATADMRFAVPGKLQQVFGYLVTY
jgi:hypothetical protein